MKDFEHLNRYAKICARKFSITIGDILEEMSDEDFAKIDTIQMNQNELDIIYRLGFCWYVMRKNSETEYIKMYSFGNMPFKVKLVD